jgi:hypothetical protein
MAIYGRGRKKRTKRGMIITIQTGNIFRGLKIKTKRR